MIRPCLFIDIDTQNDFFDPKGAMPIKGAETIRLNLKKLTKHALKKRIPLIAPVETHNEQKQILKKNIFYGIPGTKGHKKIMETFVKKNVVIPNRKVGIKYNELFKKYHQILIEKTNFDLFDNAHTLPLLKKSGVTNCVVYGVAIDYGVEAAILKLLKNGFKVWIPVDAVQPINENNREPVMKELRAKGAEMWNTEFIIKNT